MCMWRSKDVNEHKTKSKSNAHFRMHFFFQKHLSIFIDSLTNFLARIFCFVLSQNICFGFFGVYSATNTIFLFSINHKNKEKYQLDSRFSINKISLQMILNEYNCNFTMTIAYFFSIRFNLNSFHVICNRKTNNT